MTDDLDAKMAQRLADAGERWRASHTEVPATHVGVFDATEPPIDITQVPAARPRRRTAWAVGLSSVAAAAIAVVVALNIHGTSGKDGPEAIDSSGTGIDGQWVLRSLVKANGDALALVAGATLEFADGKISGTDGCNHLGGDVTIKPGMVVIGDGLATTAIACVDRQPEFDAEVAVIHDVLTGTVQWSITSDLLTLTGASGSKLVYARDAAAASTTDPRAIVGRWTLDTIGDEGANGTASSVIAGPQGPPTIEFAPDGTYLLNDGCNSGGGKARLAAGTWSDMHGASTLALCTDTAVNVQASKVDAVLDGTLVWSIKDSHLTLTKTGVGYLVYTKTASTEVGSFATDTPTTGSK